MFFDDRAVKSFSLPFTVVALEKKYRNWSPSVCSLVCQDEGGCAYVELSPVVCDLIGVQCDHITVLLHKAGLSSLGLYPFKILRSPTFL